LWHDDHGAALDAFLPESLLEAKPDSKRAEALAALLARSIRSETAAALRAASERAKPALASRLRAAAEEVAQRCATING
jgi:hypothetical protein